ncbi:MAG: HAD hydrolase-like protein [Candidatus Delongbacteria bacterium]|nr:HAD hydrolase-like protein [Candidatus Delongbacteria bacterium]MBN2836171.1 HAD hydrolase-like protein [Candidatus Delongbacteria bacterium]
MQSKTILFDLDGTITDSSIGIINSVKYALGKLGEIIPADNDLYKFIGPPLHKSFEIFCGYNEEKASYAVEVFREYFRSKGIFENRLFDGILDVLETLSKENNLFIASSKPQVFVDQILEYFKIDHLFFKTYGSSLDGSFTDKSEIIEKIIKEHDLNRSLTIMIGDRYHDETGAIENEIQFIRAGYGYGKPEEFKLTEGYVAEKPQEILEIIKNMM